MENFFIFRSKLVLSTFRAPPQDIKTNTFLNLVRGEYSEIGFPVIFKQSGGKNFKDILDTEYTSLYLISTKMKEILEKNQLTGWITYPIKLYDKKGNEILDYHGFSITGRCTEVNYRESKIIEKRMVPTGPICQFYKGALIKGWEGTDFFMPHLTAYTLITEKVAKLLLKNKISNCDIENMAEYENSVRNVNF